MRTKSRFAEVKMTVFFPITDGRTRGGRRPDESDGMLVGKFELNPKGDQSGRCSALFDP